MSTTTSLYTSSFYEIPAGGECVASAPLASLGADPGDYIHVTAQSVTDGANFAVTYSFSQTDGKAWYNITVTNLGSVGARPELVHLVVKKGDQQPSFPYPGGSNPYEAR